MARVIVETDVPCVARDGTVLATDVYRPDDGERHPVLLQRTPYDKTFYPFTWPLLDPMKMASAGFVVAIQDVRGRFGSGGDFVPFVNEATDGADAVAWAASRPWSDGSVGCYGISYMGATSWLAASERPAALRAIATATAPNAPLDNHIYRGGALQLGLLTAWTLASIAPHAAARANRDDLAALVREVTGVIDDADAIDSLMWSLPLTQWGPVAGRGLARWFDERVVAADDPSSYSVPGAPPAHSAVTTPALIVAGWNDVMLAGDLEHYAAMKQSAGSEEARRLTRLVVGPWSHGAFTAVVGEVDFGFRASPFSLDLREDFTSLHRRWFAARLRGEQTGIDDEPPVKLFVMGANRWRSEDAWPLARARTRRWHLHAGGALSPAPPATGAPSSTFELRPDDPVPTRGGPVLMHPKHMRGPRTQRTTEERDDVLLFTSEPLTAPLEVTGPVRFTAWVATETPDSDVVARLCDVAPDGTSTHVCDGIQRLRFRRGFERPAPMTPGEVESVQVDLWSVSYVFAAGHRLRLQVCASDFPRYDRCPGTGESSATAKQVVPQRNRVFHDAQYPSHLELPEVES